MRKFHDGREDGLMPLESLDLERISSFSDLLEAMGRTAFGGRQLGRALDVLVEMVRDPECTVVLTISGAMTIGKMGRVICTMIEHGMVQVVIATGALITHGLSESIGLVHYAHDPSRSDKELYEKGYNRVYDTLEMEQNLYDVEGIVVKALERLDGQVLSSEKITRAVGQYLAETTDDPGVLRSAYLKHVPVYIPAFTDCEMGLDVCNWVMKRKLAETGEKTFERAFSVVPNFNPFLDLNSYTRFLYGTRRQGILTIGGGVPRNWAQQVGPYFDLMAYRLGLPERNLQFSCGVRICPEPSHWGGLSGCTYSEGVSWGKFVPPEKGGRYAEVHADATIAWPILVKAALEKLGASPAPPTGG